MPTPMQTSSEIPGARHAIHEAGNERLGTDMFIDRLAELDPDHKLGDQGYRQELLTKASTEDYGVALASANQVLRGEPEELIVDSRVLLSSGEKGKEMVGIVGVDPVYRYDIFAKAVEVVKHFADTGDMEIAGAVMANVIVGIQLFRDGNKRTARAAYELIGKGFDGSDADQDRLHGTLDFTREARQSFWFGALDSANSRSYTMDKLGSDDERKKFEEFTRLNHSVEDGWKSRPGLEAALVNVKDSDIRKQLIDAMQQDYFGDNIVFEVVKGVNSFFTGDEISDECRVALDTFFASIDDKRAQAIIKNDTATKKEYWIRLLDSTQDVNPLPYYFNGEKVPGTTVNITGMNLDSTRQ